MSEGGFDIGKAAARLLAVDEAQTSLIRFMELMNPDPEDMEDASRSLYQRTPVARLLADVLEKVARGELKRVAISCPPQHGKSEAISKSFPAWIAGKHPHIKLILATYSQEFAEEWGGKVRAFMTSEPYQQIFPQTGFRKGGASRGQLMLDQGGELAFVGRDGRTSGKAGDVLLCDDPIKNQQEADSPTILRHIWEWFNAVAMTRCHSESAIIIVHTRWAQDDLIGRLVDKDHPDHDPEIAKLWTYINIPAVITDKPLADALGLPLMHPMDKDVIEQFGDKPMTALWPEKKGLPFLAEAKRSDKRVFEALYQGNPSPEDGDYFRREWIVPYKSVRELPPVRIYAASDHALSSKEERDASCMGVFGVDSNNEIWILPDLYWEREGDTSVLVERMIDMMVMHVPQIWWAESEHISKSLRPFLMKRRMERSKQEPNALVTLVEEMPSTVDLKQRARPINGMMSMGRVHFPVFAPWWPQALGQLLKFPNAAHDDFVSFMSLIGRGLLREMGVAVPKKSENVVRVGSLAWVKAASSAQKRRAERNRAAGGM